MLDLDVASPRCILGVSEYDIRVQRPRKPPSNKFGAFKSNKKKKISPQITGSNFYALWDAFLSAQMQPWQPRPIGRWTFFPDILTKRMSPVTSRYERAKKFSRFWLFFRSAASSTQTTGLFMVGSKWNLRQVFEKGCGKVDNSLAFTKKHF